MEERLDKLQKQEIIMRHAQEILRNRKDQVLIEQLVIPEDEKIKELAKLLSELTGDYKEF